MDAIEEEREGRTRLKCQRGGMSKVRHLTSLQAPVERGDDLESERTKYKCELYVQLEV